MYLLDENTLISGSYDASIRIWNLEDNTLINTFLGHNDGVNTLTVLNDGHILSGSSDRTIKLWEISSGECLSTYN